MMFFIESDLDPISLLNAVQLFFDGWIRIQHHVIFYQNPKKVSISLFIWSVVCLVGDPLPPGSYHSVIARPISLKVKSNSIKVEALRSSGVWGRTTEQKPHIVR